MVTLIMAAQSISPNDVTVYPWLHLVDNPFESWQSTLLFLITLVVLVIIIIFLGKQYARAITVKRCNCCCRHRPSPSSLGPGEFYDHNPATTSSHDMFQSQSGSRWLPWSTNASPPNVTIGAVNQSALAQRRRGLSASNLLSNTAP